MKRFNKFINNLFFLKNAPEVFARTYMDINKSKSYKSYCQELHGVDFSCWNTLSVNQREFLEEELQRMKPSTLLDIGSGNGELTKYLSSKFQLTATGIDFSITPEKTKSTQFIRGKFLDHSFSSKYSTIILIDSFYMINNYKKYFKKLLSLLDSHGEIIIIFTLTMEEFENSKVLKAIKSLHLEYSLTDFTKDDFNFWKSSKDLLEKYNDLFVDEGYFNLWNIKNKEADKNVQLHNTCNTSRLALIIKRG